MFNRFWFVNLESKSRTDVEFNVSPFWLLECSKLYAKKRHSSLSFSLHESPDKTIEWICEILWTHCLLCELVYKRQLLVSMVSVSAKVLL